MPKSNTVTRQKAKQNKYARPYQPRVRNQQGTTQEAQSNQGLQPSGAGLDPSLPQMQATDMTRGGLQQQANEVQAQQTSVTQTPAIQMPAIQMPAREMPLTESGTIYGNSINNFPSTTPTPLISSCDPVGEHVNQSLREKIWKGDYIDLALLLDTNLSNETHTISIVNGSLQVKGKPSKIKLDSIDTWLDAFIIYMAIYTQKHSCFQELLKYVTSIRLAAKHFPGLRWKQYDEQFRIRQGKHPERSWGVIDAELWLTCLMTSTALNVAPQIVASPSSKGKCYDFNYKVVPKVEPKQLPDNNLMQSLWDLGKTPIRLSALYKFLADYPFRVAAEQLKNGFSNGFQLCYEGPRITRESKNLKSALQNPEIISEKLSKEIIEGRILGPFNKKPISNLQVSPVGLVPKKSGGWRLIMHLSHPVNASINDFIHPNYTSVTYTSFDQAMALVQAIGKGALLAKKDIKSAFRLLPVYPGDFDLLGIKVQDKYYIDKCLPMGCSISCATFEKFSSFIEWLVKQRSGMSSLVHYLDDFLFCGPPNSSVCKHAIDTFDQVCSELGVPIAEEKSEGPTTCLVFLGLEIDTLNEVVRVPNEKVVEVTAVLLNFLQRSKVQLRELQQLLGLLAFCARAMPCARAFSRRLYALLSSAKCPHHFIRITKSVKDDLNVWLKFFKQFNGNCNFLAKDWISNTELELYTDSAGSSDLGCGAVFGKRWTYFKWPEAWCNSDILKDITFLELVPIAIALCAWKDIFSNKRLLFWSDNLALVEILNSKSSKSERVMSFIRPLVLLALENNIYFKAMHVKGSENKLADALSRLQFKKFKELSPLANQFPTPIPQEFWENFRIDLIS